MSRMEIVYGMKGGWCTSLFARSESLFQLCCMHHSPFCRHPLKVVTRHSKDTSTSNLNKHIKTCEPSRSAEQESIKKFAYGCNYVKAKFRAGCVRWIARRRRPFAIIGDPELHDLFKMLYDKVEIPNRRMISRDIKKVYQHSRRKVKQMLRVCCLYNFVNPD
jgi:hypothetical protein